MNFVALKMLVADRAKYFGLIFAIAFASFLLANQISIFIGIMTRPSSQIQDVVDADIWVMDPQTLYSDEVYALRDYDLYRVRSVPGVEWAVPLYKGLGRAKGPDGRFRTVILLGVDDASLVGAPRKMLLGSIHDLDQPDAAIIDRAGFLYFFPGEPLQAGKTLQMNEKRVLIVGISDASAPFQSFPVLHTRYSQALGFVGREPFLPAEHRHPRELRHYGNDCSDRRHCGTRADLLHLHHREPETVWRSEGHRRNQSANHRDDLAASDGCWRHRLRPRHGHGRGLLCEFLELSADARNRFALAGHGSHRGGRALCGRTGQPDEHPPRHRPRTRSGFPGVSTWLQMELRFSRVA